MARWSADCTLEELLEQQRELRESLNDLDKLIFEKRIKNNASKLGVVFGKTLVEFRGKTHVIASYETHLNNFENSRHEAWILDWILGREITKSGLPSKNIKYLYLSSDKPIIVGEYND